MLADKQKVLNLIPQKPPMAMVDGLLASDEEKTVATLTITAENLFTEDGVFTEPGLIEHIAQTAALRSGYRASLSNEEPPVGFIGSVKRMKIFLLPKVGDTLVTTMTVVMNMENISIIKGEVLVNGKPVAEGEMNIFLQEKQ
jgi:3-hydroxymyristoyl/3-hydroxydecanoyl-(acyl carrier protein) dehydratase